MEQNKGLSRLVVASVLEDWAHDRMVDTVYLAAQACPESTRALIDDLRLVIFPGICPEEERLQLLRRVGAHLHSQLSWACTAAGQNYRNTAAIADDFFGRIPAVRALIQTDLIAALHGDPAATCPEELVCCYPGVYALTVYRLAHALYTLNVPLLPRIMTEYAHSVTGIDIHPGARIGSHFFIDHGTGTVIGQTAHIGSHVQLYQGVTLGALSPRNGEARSGPQRHPTVEDGVTIYAGATVLGGQTVIGTKAVIGANAFVTASVPACVTVTGRYPVKKEHPPV